MTKEQLIDSLNGDLTDEFASAIQYINHAALITGARFGSTQKELLVHATEEMQHATTIADQVAFLEELGVRRVAPAHCTGMLAFHIFRQMYGKRLYTGRLGLPDIH